MCLGHISRSRSGGRGSACARRRRRGRACHRADAGQGRGEGDGWRGGAGANAPGTSRTVDLGGPVHYVDFGGPDDAPDGRPRARPGRLAPELGPVRAPAAAARPGAGARPARLRAERARRPRATVHDNVAVLDRFLTEVAGDAGRAGGQLDGRDDLDPRAAARAPEWVRGLVLLDPAVPGPRGALDPWWPAASPSTRCPVVGERFLWLRRQRQTPLRRVRECCGSAAWTPRRCRPRSSTGRSTLIEQRRGRRPAWTRPSWPRPGRCCRLLADPRRYRAAMAAMRRRC